MAANIATDRDRLSQRTIGISVSDGGDFLRLGLLEREFQKALAEIVVALVYRGARIAYGGDLRSNGFTRAMFKEVAGAYALGNLDKRVATFIHYVAFPVWNDWSAAQLFEHVVSLEMTGEVRLFRRDGSYCTLIGDETGVSVRGAPSGMGIADVVTAPEGLRSLWATKYWPRFAKWMPRIPRLQRRSADSTQMSDALSAMRKTMAAELDARIIIGGRLAGYQGNAPGIAEEALGTLQYGKILIPLAGYGGCTRFVAHALGLLDEADLLKQDRLGRNFHETLQQIGELKERYLDDLASRGVDRETLVRIARTDTPGRLAEECTTVLVKALGSG
jgi:hypothetical protein